MGKKSQNKFVAAHRPESLQHQILRQSGGTITKDDPESQKKKTKKKKKNPLLRPRDADSFTREIARMYGTEVSAKEPPEKKKTKLQSQLPGESYKQFTKRLYEDQRKAILEETRKSRKSSAKRKSFLASKKERERTKKRARTNPERDFEGPEKLRFGEVADRPPEFNSASDNTSAPAGARLALQFPQLAKPTSAADAMRLTAVARYRELKKTGRIAATYRKNDEETAEMPGAYL